MKKLAILGAAIIAAISFTSCDNNAEESIIDNSKIKVNATVGDLESGSTRALKSGWKNGDKLNVWFNESTAAVSPQLILTYKDGEWEAGTIADGVDLGTSGTLKVFYEETNNLLTTTRTNPTVFPSRFKLGDPGYALATSTSYVYQTPLMCYSNSVAYTVSGNTLTMSISEWTRFGLNQVVITGLPESNNNPANFILRVMGEEGTTGAAGLTAVKYITVQSPGVMIGQSSADYLSALANEDGIAFCYGTAASADEQTYRFKLYDIANNKVYKYSAKGTLNTDNKKTKGIKIAFSKFSQAETVDSGF